MQHIEFTNLLDSVIGPRIIFHQMECDVCAFDLIYYQDPDTSKQNGMACEQCNYVKKFEFKVE